MSMVPQAILESPVHDDIDARRMLQYAQGIFQKWPEGFAGFRAMTRCCDGSRVAVGTVSVFAGGRVELDVSDAGLAAWVRCALATIASARTPQFFKDGDGRFPISFERDDAHSLGLGVRVHLGQSGWRTYRIDAKGRVRQQGSVEWTTRAASIYEGFVRACLGRVLPTRLHIFNWDVSTHKVSETADIDDAYERRAHVWLPVQRRATVRRDHQRRELGFELSDHVLL